MQNRHHRGCVLDWNAAGFGGSLQLLMKILSSILLVLLLNGCAAEELSELREPRANYCREKGRALSLAGMTIDPPSIGSRLTMKRATSITRMLIPNFTDGLTRSTLWFVV